MSYSLPPIAKLAEQLLAAIEQAVSRFPRPHRYTAGADLRSQAMHVTELVHRAWRDRARQRVLIHELVWAIDALKIRLQLCCRLKAFASFAQFEDLARNARTLGKQAGGWYRQHAASHRNGQNAHGEHDADAQRAQKLSTRGTARQNNWAVYA